MISETISKTKSIAMLIVAASLTALAPRAFAQAGVEAGGLGAASATAASSAGKSTGGALGGALGRIGGGLGAATAGSAGSTTPPNAAPPAPAPETTPLSMGSRRPRYTDWATISGANPTAPAKVWAPQNIDALGKGFENAYVHLANRNESAIWHGSEVDEAGKFTVSAMPLSGLVWLAFVGTRQVAQVAGGPTWMDTNLWDINAQLDEADMTGWATLTDAQRMERVRPQLRALLIDRFALTMHTEMKMTPVYALVQAKGGVKMKMVSAPLAPTSGLVVSNSAWEGHAVQVSTLAPQIGFQTGAQGKMLVDQTGLSTFYYDFTLKLTPGKDPEQQIEDGLGLRVEQRTIPIKTYVVDAAELPTN